MGKALKQKMTRNQFVQNYKRMWPFVKPIWPIALLSLLICVPVGSLDAAIALSRKVLSEGESAVKDYIRFLSGGFYTPLT